MKRISAKKGRFIIGFKGYALATDERIADGAYAADAYGFDFEKGALTANIGASAAQINGVEIAAIEEGKSIKNVFMYRYSDESGRSDRIVAQLDDGSIWYALLSDPASWTRVEGLEMHGDVSAVNYDYKGRNMLLMSSEEDGMRILVKDTAYANASSPRFTSLAVYNERVFGCLKGKSEVWFSDDFDPNNWNVSPDEAGYVDFNDEGGVSLAVIAFAGHLYIFREYSVFRLTAYSAQSEFSLKSVLNDTGRILKGSIAVCSDRILFCADNGIFSFDGYDATPINGGHLKIPRSENVRGAYLDGEYFLACPNLDGGENSAIVRYNVANGDISALKGACVRELKACRTSLGSHMLCVMNGEHSNALGEIDRSGKIFGHASEKYYRSPIISLSNGGIKTLRSMTLSTEYPLTVRITLDGKVFEHALVGSKALQTVFVERPFRQVMFELKTDSERAKASPITVKFDLLEV